MSESQVRFAKNSVYDRQLFASEPSCKSDCSMRRQRIRTEHHWPAARSPFSVVRFVGQESRKWPYFANFQEI